MLKGLQGLRSWVTVVRTGSVRAAASKLHYDPSRVRAHVRSLEAELRVRLLRRGPDGAPAVTPAGRQLMPQAQRALDEVRRVEDQAQSLADSN